MDSILELDKTDPTPLYLQIAQWVQTQIDSGIWPDNHKLLSEENLAKAMSVSRGTLRKSIQHMIGKGQLIQVHGRGTFVSSGQIEQPLAESLMTISEAMDAQGLSFTTNVLCSEAIPATATVAEAFHHQQTNAVLDLKRIRFVNDIPVVYLENVVSLACCAGIEHEDFRQVRLFDAIEKTSGKAITHGTRRFDARLAGETIAAKLQIDPALPVLFLEQSVSLEDGRLVEFSRVWFRGDKIKLTSSLTR